MQFIGYAIVILAIALPLWIAFSPTSPFYKSSDPAMAPTSDNGRIEELEKRLDAIEKRLERIEGSHLGKLSYL